jgi:Tfp pilus assembly protein FimT
MKALPGATLIELLVVIALMGLIAGVVTPALRSMSPVTPDSPSAQVSALMRLARARAIDRAEVVRLTIDPAGGRFWLDRPDTAGTIPLANGASLSGADRVHFRFFPTGEMTAEPLVITEEGVARAVRVERWTGEVTIGAR